MKLLFPITKTGLTPMNPRKDVGIGGSEQDKSGKFDRLMSFISLSVAGLNKLLDNFAQGYSTQVNFPFILIILQLFLVVFILKRFQHAYSPSSPEAQTRCQQ